MKIDQEMPLADPTMNAQDVWLESSDGVRVHSWFIESGGRTRPTVLWLQENAGNMAYRLLFIKPMVSILRCNVLMLMYRGYGISEGKPTEEGLRKDARAALKHLLQVRACF